MMEQHRGDRLDATVQQASSLDEYMSVYSIYIAIGKVALPSGSMKV